MATRKEEMVLMKACEGEIHEESLEEYSLW